MDIRPPDRFVHAAQIHPRFSSLDPRSPGFNEEEVVIDLRSCTFVRPAAVLWCVIYPLLAHARGSTCTLIVPNNMGVCIYLKSLGLFNVLTKNGIEVDDRGIPERADPQVVLPLTKFTTQFEVEQLANEALDALASTRLGASNLYPLVSEIFAELGLNAVEHAGSLIESYGFIQFYEFEDRSRFVCGVADGGIGIRSSLEKNPDIRHRVHYDWSAIELAVRERISGTGEKTRGIGLYGVAEDMRLPNRQLIIHSGIGSLQISEEVETEARRTNLFPGTLVYASIPT